LKVSIFLHTGFKVHWPPDFQSFFIIKETLNKYHFLTIRHSGESRNLVKTINYWMPVFTGMTVKTLLYSFLNL
jgi:hypothetical protein